MFNEDQLKKLGEYIADSLIEIALQTNGDDWIAQDSHDHILGELARCITLQNLFLSREEYEKCAAMKIKIDKLTQMLDIEDDFNPTDFQDEQ